MMNRKTFLAGLLLATASFLTLSCLKEETGADTPKVPEDGIVLRIFTDTPGTKTDYPIPMDGETARNENLIVNNKVDIFFFKDSTATAQIRKRILNVTVQEGAVSIPVTYPDVVNIFNGVAPNESECNVVVVANYSGGDASVYSECATRGDIYNLPLEVAHWSNPTQDSFVMRGSSNLLLLNARGSTPAKGDVKLKRLAAKISFNLTVTESTNDSGTVWSPNTGSMSVYLVYAMRHGVLGGTPTRVPNGVKGVDYKLATSSDDLDPTMEDALLYEYQGRSLIDSGVTAERTRGSGADSYTEVCPVFVAGFKDVNTGTVTDSDSPFYSYPSTWDYGITTEPYLKLIIPWTTVVSGATRTKYYYYKIPFSINKLESNNWYRIYIDVQILGGEEPVPPVASVSYCISDWEGQVDMSTASVETIVTVIPATVVAARYLSVPTTEYILYNTDDLEIPITSSHEVEVVGFNINKNNAYKAAHMVDANYVGTNPRIYNPFFTDEEHHLVEDNIVISKPNYSTDPAKPDSLRITFGTAASGTYGWSVTAPGTGKEKVLVHHTLNRDLSSNNTSYDVAPYTIRMRIRHKDELGKDSYFTDVTIEQRPPIMIHPEANEGGTANYGYAFVNGAQNAGENYTRSGWYGNYTYSCNDGSWTSTSNMGSYFTYYLGSSPSDLSNSNNKNVNMYVIETSVLPSQGNISKYVLGDPRSLTVDNLNGTKTSFNHDSNPASWANQSAVLRDWDGTDRDLSYYYPVGTDTSFNKMIAPRIRIASSFGATVYMTYYDAFRRCASYQESGYPAGRWRIPTKAEIEYIAKLNSDDMIPLLLGSSSGTTDYWCNSGYMRVEQGKTPTYYQATTTSEGYVRCVYDDWYWSESTRSHLPADKINTFTWGDMLRSSVQIDD